MPETKVLKINADSPDEDVISYAAGVLCRGGLVAFPTETVYGIGANLLDKDAIRKLYQIKKRPPEKPFTVHISSIDMIEKMRCEIPDFAKTLANKFWPGPLTVILKETSSTCQAEQGFRLAGGKVGFRMPKNNVAKALIEKSGVPVVAPSANLSGKKPPVEAKEILEDLDGQIDLVLDGGKTELGRESTIVDTTVVPYKILREGAISREDIERIADSG